MSDVTVESLQLEVQSSADGAARSIDTLTSTLGKLKSATKGIGLTGVVNQIRNLDSALKSVDGSSADKIDKLIETDKNQTTKAKWITNSSGKKRSRLLWLRKDALEDKEENE